MGGKSKHTNPNKGVNGGRVSNHGRPKELGEFDGTDRFVQRKASPCTRVVVAAPKSYHSALYYDEKKLLRKSDLQKMASNIGSLSVATYGQEKLAAYLTMCFKKEPDLVLRALETPEEGVKG